MGTYGIAEVCLNGHVATSSADRHPELREKFCSKCGEQTISRCQSCETTIRGYYHTDGVITFDEYRPPSFCHNCGNSFPWTERGIASAIELVEISTDLQPEEIEQFRTDLAELTKESAKTQIASIRYKRVMKKVGTTVASGVREVMIGVLSETAKRAIWGG